MTLPRVMAMNRYWGKHPPVHIMVASYLGFVPEKAASTSASHDAKDNSEQDLDEFMQQFSGAGGAIG
jgi:hypothetical protein